MFSERYRREERPKPILINAICVNQVDLHERTLQVQLMGKIYGQAATVVVWLGDNPPNDLQVLDTATAHALLSEPFSQYTVQHTWDLIIEVVSAVMRFMSDTYWTRTWIVQEILLTRVVKVYYGRASTVPLASVHKWRSQITANINSMRSSDELIQWRVTITDPQSPSNKKLDCKFPNREGDWFQAELQSRRTANMIAHFINTECADSRDKVYAFLGMSRDHDSYGVVADYTKTVADLFFEVCDAQTQTWLGRRLAFARSLQNALGCTYAVLKLTATCRCRIESGALDFVIAQDDEVHEFGNQDFSNIVSDERSLQAVIISCTDRANLEDGHEPAYTESASRNRRQVVVLSRTHIQDGDWLFRLNGSHVYMYCPLDHRPLAAAGSDGLPEDGSIKPVSYPRNVRILPVAAVNYTRKALRRVRVCYPNDNRSRLKPESDKVERRDLPAT